MDTIELRKWAETHSIESRTVQSFWENFNGYKEEQEDEFIKNFGKDFDENKLDINMDKIALFIDAWSGNTSTQYGFDYVISYIPIYYDDEQLGEFRMYFNLDGKHFDDFFVTF